MPASALGANDTEASPVSTRSDGQRDDFEAGLARQAVIDDGDVEPVAGANRIKRASRTGPFSQLVLG